MLVRGVNIFCFLGIKFGKVFLIQLFMESILSDEMYTE